MSTPKRLAPLTLAVLLAGCGHFSVAPARKVFSEERAPGARLVLRGELAFALASGTPEEIGAGVGEVSAEAVRDVLSSWKRYDALRALAQTAVAGPAELEAAVPAEYRREVAALASAARVDARDLLRANAVVDACSCTAFVASGADGNLVFGRNLDFAPAHVLGPSTLVLVVRSPGARAFVSVGWPGFSSVASGMNEEGLCAAILINQGARPRGPGISLGFLVRRILERCGTVEEARALFHACPPASGHFLFLADARTAAVVSRDAADRVVEDGLLACTNAPVDAAARLQTDRRSRAVHDLVLAARGSLDPGEAGRILAATYLRGENTHAMVFEPAKRVLWLARGTTFAPAALGGWDRIALGAALRGAGEPVATTHPPVERPYRHYRSFEYPGLLVERRLSESR